MGKSNFLVLLVLAASSPLAAQNEQGAGASTVVTDFDALKTTAEAGDPVAQWRLGMALDGGDGVSSDPAKAVFWFREAIKGGSAAAHASLALMYATGRGVAVDYSAARELYHKAAKLGEPHGFFGMGVLHARGEGVPKNMAEAFAWMIVATAAGDEQAINLINSGAFADITEVDSVQTRVEQIADEFGVDISGLAFQPSSQD